MRVFCKSAWAYPPRRNNAPSPVWRSKTSACSDDQPHRRRSAAGLTPPSSASTRQARCHSSSKRPTSIFPWFCGPLVTSMIFVCIRLSMPRISTVRGDTVGNDQWAEDTNAHPSLEGSGHKKWKWCWSCRAGAASQCYRVDQRLDFSMTPRSSPLHTSFTRFNRPSCSRPINGAQNARVWRSFMFMASPVSVPCRPTRRCSSRRRR